MSMITRIFCFQELPNFALFSLDHFLGSVFPSWTLSRWKLSQVGLPFGKPEGQRRMFYSFLIDKIPSFLGQEVDSLEDQVFSCLYFQKVFLFSHKLKLVYAICCILNWFSKSSPINLMIVVNSSKIIVLGCLIVVFFFVMWDFFLSFDILVRS